METFEMINNPQIIVSILTVVGGGILLAAGWYLLIAVVLKEKYNSGGRTIIGVVLNTIYYPVLVYILGQAVLFGGGVVNDSLDVGLEALLVPSAYLLRLGCVTWCVLLFTKHIGEYFGIVISNKVQRLDKDRIVKVITVASRLVQALFVLMAVLIAMDHFGFNITSIIALGSVSGLVLGLAAQDILSNLLGRVTLYMEKPFALGDHVICNGVEGIAINMKWRITEIQTFDRHTVYVPNNILINNPIHNHTRRTNRRINQTIGVRYDDAAVLRGLIEKIEQALIAHPNIDENDTMVVKFAGFGPSSLDIMVYALMRETDWAKSYTVRHDVFLKIIDVVAECGAEFAFPTRTLHMLGADADSSSSKVAPAGLE